MCGLFYFRPPVGGRSVTPAAMMATRIVSWLTDICAATSESDNPDLYSRLA